MLVVVSHVHAQLVFAAVQSTPTLVPCAARSTWQGVFVLHWFASLYPSQVTIPAQSLSDGFLTNNKGFSLVFVLVVSETNFAVKEYEGSAVPKIPVPCHSVVHSPFAVSPLNATVTGFVVADGEVVNETLFPSHAFALLPLTIRNAFCPVNALCEELIGLVPSKLQNALSIVQG
ncbi:Uncharacterised protein [uncultured archaeon]|nr:Uncharacterised protein [uncultured archaeon]